MDQDQQQLRNLRDFLLVYNRMTEICFQRCTSNLNYRNLTMDEERCVDSCAGKLIRSNHRLMGTYVQLMPGIVQRRLEEMEAKAGEMGQSAEAGPSTATVSTAITALPEGTVAESLPEFIPTSAGLVGEIPPVVAPPAGGVTVDILPAMAPSTGGVTVDVPPVIAPSSGGVAVARPPVIVPSSGGLAVAIPPIIAPSTGGAMVDLPPVILPPTGGISVDIPPTIMPPTGGVQVDFPPVLAPPTTVETVQMPQSLPQTPGEMHSNGAPVPVSLGKQPLSETLKCLPDLAVPPPVLPPEKLPLPQQVNPTSPPGSDPSTQSVNSGPSNHDSHPQSPSQ